jgi:hypothetical protein
MHASLFPQEKSTHKICRTSVTFNSLPQVNNRPRGEHWPESGHTVRDWPLPRSPHIDTIVWAQIPFIRNRKKVRRKSGFSPHVKKRIFIDRHPIRKRQLSVGGGGRLSNEKNAIFDSNHPIYIIPVMYQFEAHRRI